MVGKKIKTWKLFSFVFERHFLFLCNCRFTWFLFFYLYLVFGQHSWLFPLIDRKLLTLIESSAKNLILSCYFFKKRSNLPFLFKVSIIFSSYNLSLICHLSLKFTWKILLSKGDNSFSVKKMFSFTFCKSRDTIFKT